MSAEARPIPAYQFALAIQNLPLENIYTKAEEIQNSINRLRFSNKQLHEWIDGLKNNMAMDRRLNSEEQRICFDAIAENEIVIGRQQERMDLLKKEVETRGASWHETDTRSARKVNGTVEHTTTTNGTDPGPIPNAALPQRPRLTDEELRQRLAEQLGEDEEDADGGMHL